MEHCKCCRYYHNKNKLLIVGTIVTGDVGKGFRSIERLELPCGLGWGFVCVCDIGKRIYARNNKYYIENTEQKDKRLEGMKRLGV